MASEVQTHIHSTLFYTPLDHSDEVDFAPLLPSGDVEDWADLFMLVQAGDMQPFIFLLSNVTDVFAFDRFAFGWKADVL